MASATLFSYAGRGARVKVRKDTQKERKGTQKEGLLPKQETLA